MRHSRPKIWKVYNEKLGIFIHNKYYIIHSMKMNGINEKQLDTYINKGKVYQKYLVTLNSVKDCGKYYYVGITPEDIIHGRWGYVRIYKDTKNTEYPTRLIKVKD